MRVVAFSDLHMLARRSGGVPLLNQLITKAKHADAIVICGDLFDFRWSEAPALEAAFTEATAILKEVLSSLPTATALHYILGNHDSNAEFLPHLEQLQAATPNFQWHDACLRLGDTLFLHGDIPMKSEGALLSPRPSFKQNEKIWGRAMNTMYDLITWTRLVNIYRKAVDANRKLPYILKAVRSHCASDLPARLVFGHSHHHFTERSVGEFVVTNLGSGVAGYRCNLQELEISHPRA